MARALPALLLLATAAAAQDGTPAFPRHLDARHTTLLVVADPLPHLESLFRSERFRRLLAGGRLGRALGTFGRPPDPREWASDVADARPYIPTEIVVGFTEEGLIDVARILEAMTIFDVVMTAETSADDEVLAGIPELRAKVLRLLEAVSTPRCTIWVRFRSEMEAEGMGQILGLQVRALATEGLETKPIRDGWEIAFRGRTLGEEDLDVWANVLAGDSASEEDLEAFSEAIQALEFRCRLERIGDGLRLSFGAPAPAATPALDLKSLGPLCTLDATTLVFGHWQIGAVRDYARVFRKDVEALRATPLGRHHSATDDTGLVDAFLDAARLIEGMGSVGAMRIWVDDALHLRSEERGAAPAAPLEAVLRALPAEAEIVAVDGTRSAAGLLGTFVLTLEERLTSLAFREEVGSAPTGAVAIEEAYYESFSRFREALFTDLPKGFLAPSAFVATSRGRLKRLSVRAKGLPPASIEGGVLPEVALIGRVNGMDALRLLSACYARLADGIASAAGAKSDIRAASLREADLGLGARSFLLEGAWLRDLLAEKGRTTEFEGDFRPHVAVEGDLLILSSSPALSRAILAAHRGEKGRLEFPAAGGNLVAAGRIPGRTLSACLDRGIDLVALFLDPRQPVKTPGSDLVRDFVVGISELLDEVTWRIADERDLRVTEVHVTFPK